MYLVFYFSDLHSSMNIFFNYKLPVFRKFCNYRNSIVPESDIDFIDGIIVLNAVDVVSQGLETVGSRQDVSGWDEGSAAEAIWSNRHLLTKKSFIESSNLKGALT